MKIVIDISKHIYEHAKAQSEDSNDEWDAMRAIAKGTPLPKKYGRLIDADAITKNIEALQNSFVINMDYMTGKILGCECLAPTIIEGSDNNDT